MKRFTRVLSASLSILTLVVSATASAGGTLASEFKRREYSEADSATKASIQSGLQDIKKLGLTPVVPVETQTDALSGTTLVFVETREGKICRLVVGGYQNPIPEVPKCL